MNVIRDGVILAVWTFSIILAFIFLSSPLALLVTSIAAASDAPQMASIEAEVIAVFGICCALLVLIPSIVFIYLAFISGNEEYQY